MHHDPLFRRSYCDSPLFRHRVVASSQGAKYLFILTHPLGFAGFSNGRLQSQVHAHSHSGYDNGYLAFFNEDFSIDIWRLAGDLSAEGEVAAHSPPDSERMIASARAAEVYHHYAPRGHFRPWALLGFPEFMYRPIQLRYPTLMCLDENGAYFYDVRTCSLVQTINFHLHKIFDVDVNERHAFVCETDVVHVFSRESGSEILRIPTDVPVRYSQLVEDPALVPGDWFITPLSLSPDQDPYFRSPFRGCKLTVPLWLIHPHLSYSQGLHGWPRSPNHVPGSYTGTFYSRFRAYLSWRDYLQPGGDYP